MIKKAALVDYIGRCQSCLRCIRSKDDRGGYVEYYEHDKKIYCQDCVISKNSTNNT